MILRVKELSVAGPHVLRILFSDGTCKTVDVRPLLTGPIFEPLKDSTFFATVRLNTEAGVPTWPNDADIAPEALYELASVQETSVA